MILKSKNGFISKVEVEEFTNRVLQFMFPGILEGCRARRSLKRIYGDLKELLGKNGLQSRIDVKVVASRFVSELPELHDRLLDDAAFIAQNDPAASSVDEVIVTYPGFFAISVYRLAHLLAENEITLIPRIMTEYAHSKTGIDIHPRATIGHSFFIDHGTGIVIGETAIIGNNVKLYQGVTIGALSVSKEHARIKRHPTIEDNVVIYAGSTILGGDTVIGRNSVIGGNVWLTKSVVPNSLVYHESKVIVREREFKPVNSL